MEYAKNYNTRSAALAGLSFFTAELKMMTALGRE